MLTVQGLTKNFGDHTAVSDFHLHIEEGEFVTLLGPSGSGKSTVLRMIAGLSDPSAGTISIAGKDVTKLAPQLRNIGLVFQSYALFPNMTVRDNIAFPLTVRKWSKEKIRHRVDEMLELVGLKHREKYLPELLSGGERQRVALARSLAFHPPLLLLDEPLSALDAKVRESLRDSLKEVQRTMGVTTLMVTHDQSEALELSDRTVVMNHGQVEQVGTPEEIYYEPATEFTARFIGSVNRLQTKVAHVETLADGAHRVTLHWHSLSFDWLFHAQQGMTVGEERAVFIRPESVRLTKEPNQRAIGAKVVRKTFMGAVTKIDVAVGTEILTANVLSPHVTDVGTGTVLYVSIEDKRLPVGRENETHVAQVTP